MQSTTTCVFEIKVKIERWIDEKGGKRRRRKRGKV
jgi:hypothetical protein